MRQLALDCPRTVDRLTRFTMTERAPLPPSRGARVRISPVLVYGGAIALGAGLSIAGLPLPLPLGRMERVAVGAVLGIAALVLAAATLRLFRRSGQNPLPWTPTPLLLTSGPYRFSRNPMYLAATILQVAIGLGANNGWIIVLSGAALAVVHVVAVRPEETYLREKFGDTYRDYAARVRRYL